MEDENKIHNKKEKIISDYNKTASIYDKRYEAIQDEKYQTVIANYRDFNKIILDLGSGTGLFFEYLLKSNLIKLNTRCKYVAIDISMNMLLKFRSKIFKYNNLKCRPNFILSDIDYLPFREDIFELVFSFTSFQNLPYIKRGIKELVRVSKTNAHSILSILKKNLDLDYLLNILKSYMKDIIVIQKENLEDFIIQGKIHS
ncbi:MAG: class I SAM-dependent methyltransferase [Promethearchaeota archaeon]